MSTSRSSRPRRSDLGGRGLLGEDAAAAWYAARGYRAMARNWRCRQGEIDLVMAKGQLLVVVEVKARSSPRFGTPAEAVTPTKLARLRRLAGAYLAAHPHHGDVRIDVAEVYMQRDGTVIVDVIEGVI